VHGYRWRRCGHPSAPIAGGKGFSCHPSAAPVRSAHAGSSSAVCCTLSPIMHCRPHCSGVHER
jgi:hypothetical protein